MKKILSPIVVLFAAATVLAFGGKDQGMVETDKVYVIETPAFYPTVDVHVHMQPAPEAYDLAVKSMDAAGVAVTINLSGGSGETLDKNLELARKYPGRFVTFCGVRARGDEWKAPDIGEKFAKSIQESHDKGAVGFGETVKWALHGNINWDDPRLEPMWNKLEELHMPINWHVGDPSRYWWPESPYNTLEGPSYYKNAPLKQELLMQQERVLEKHPNLIVIASHSNYLMDEIPLLVYRFEKYPNYNIDISAATEEWGRVPEEFLHIAHDYQDRIFYGTDASYGADDVTANGDIDKAVARFKAFHVAHFLFLGTSQKMIPCPFNGNYGCHLIYWEKGYTRYANDGVALPKDILEKIYYKNAERMFGIKVADWKPETPVSFETKADWQLPEPPGARRRGQPRLESTPAGQAPAAAM